MTPTFPDRQILEVLPKGGLKDAANREGCKGIADESSAKKLLRCSDFSSDYPIGQVTENAELLRIFSTGIVIC
jgi:hypothetical protein